LGEARTDDWEKTEDGTEKYSATTSEVKVEWIREPATATENISATGNTGVVLGWVIQQSGGDIGSGVNQADEPVVLVIIWGSGHGVDTKLGRERQVGTVRSGLIPTPAETRVGFVNDVSQN
jgi:hypothetical protein